MTLSVDFSATPEGRYGAEIQQLCDAMEEADRAGRYPRLTVERPWSAHNPVLEGEFASPRAIRWYLERELGRLAAHGARISVCPGREALDLHDPNLAPAVDETRWDLRRKKLFLFTPERMALSIDRLEHYTGTTAESFQRYVLLTNYSWHVAEFRAALPGCSGPDTDGRQMPAWHHMLPGRSGVSIVNIGVGPSNAKTITDHLAVLRPDLVLMIGHCAGLRNHQDIGDLVLATGYMRDDRVLDEMLPLSVPVISNHTLNTLLLGELTARGLPSRMGIVYTTANRNWELNLTLAEDRLRQSRALAVDMESATVATNGFRYRVPTATLLAVSDKPLHAEPKLSADAQRFYGASRRQHVEIAISVTRKVRDLYPGGLPVTDLRSADEPLLGTTDPEPAPLWARRVRVNRSSPCPCRPSSSISAVRSPLTSRAEPPRRGGQTSARTGAVVLLPRTVRAGGRSTTSPEVRLFSSSTARAPSSCAGIVTELSRGDVCSASWSGQSATIDTSSGTVRPLARSRLSSGGITASFCTMSPVVCGRSSRIRASTPAAAS